jgi:hypothetical protein
MTKKSLAIALKYSLTFVDASNMYGLIALDYLELDV